MASGRRLLAGAVAGLILLLSLVLVNLSLRSGPVEFAGAEVVQEAGFVDAEDGTELIFGGNWVQNLGDAKASLHAADLVDSDGDATAAEVVEARVLPQDLIGEKSEAWAVGSLAKPGPRRSWQMAEPLEGYVIAPGETLVLFLKVVVHDSTETSRWRKTELSYSAEGRDYVTESNFGFSVCGAAACEGR